MADELPKPAGLNSRSKFMIPHLRWWIMGLLMLGSMINYLTRATLANAAPTLRHDFNLTDAQFGYINSAFQGTIMLQPFCGWVMDAIGLKLGFAIFATAWSLITMAHGLATGWVSLAWLRGLLGLPEGAANPAGMKATAVWFPAQDRGFAGGLFNIGASFGSIAAPPLVVWAILHHNWQFAFVITGGLGLVWVVLWLLLYDSPDQHRWITPKEEAHIAAGQEPHLAGDGRRPSVISLAGRRNFWGIALPRFLADPTWSMLSTWLPLYLYEARHFNLKDIALTAWLPFVAADLGCMFGGVVVRFLQHRGVSLLNARRSTFTLGAWPDDQHGPGGSCD